MTGGHASGRGVGRANELAAAAFARDAARAGRGSVLAVIGAPGAGKTWFCETIVERAVGEGFRVGWGSGWPGGEAPVLWPWRQAVGPLDEPAAERLFTSPPDVGGPPWFEHCVAVVEHLRRLAAAQPTLVVIDDAHHADEPSRLLLHFVARHVRGFPLVLVAAYPHADDLAALADDATAVALHGLDPEAAAEVLAARGVDGLTDGDAAFVAAATGGLPGSLHQLASTATDAAGVVGTLVEQRLADLPPHLARVAARAAVVGPRPRFEEVRALGFGDETDPDGAAAELERRGLASRRPPDSLVFGHEQVRAALVATLDPDEVRYIHARMTGLLAAGPPSLDRLVHRAEHALAASERSATDARVAVRAVDDAAALLLDRDDPDRAIALLAAADAAHEAAGLGAPPAWFLATRGRALLRRGRLAAAREQFGRAAVAAEETGDASSLALAALGLGGVWLAEERSLIERRRYVDLLRRARDGLPADEVTLRLRLDVRLAAEHGYETGDLEGIEAQVATARAHEDPAVLAEALMLYHNTMLGPEHRAARAAVAAEMLSTAARTTEGSTSVMALLWLTTDRFLEGDPQAERSLRDLRERAATMAADHVVYIASVMDVMLLQREGRTAEAEQAAEAAFELGTEIGEPDAVGYRGGQLVALRWIEGRSGEVLDLAAETEASPTLTPPNQAFTAGLACLAAACGELDRARAALRPLRGRLHRVQQTSAWLVTLFSVVEAAHVLGDVEAAEEAAQLMAPYADLPVMGSLAVTCLGSVRRSLGLAAITAGELDAGIGLLEEAIAHDERLGNRPLAAITMADLAQARVDRGRGDDRRIALELLDRAVREAETMDLGARAEEWRARRAAIGPADPTPAAPLDEVGTIERRGRSWVLSAAGHEVVVPDLLGMTYLVELLTRPGVEIAATALVSDGSDTAAALTTRPEQPVLDPAALAAYRQRVAELEDDLAEAERHADTERAARARIELDAVVDELTRSTNRFGRARRFSSANERARTAVQKAVRRTLDQIANLDPDLGAVLRSSVRTGRTCCYEPGPGAPARWDASRLS